VGAAGPATGPAAAAALEDTFGRNLRISMNTTILCETAEQREGLIIGASHRRLCIVKKGTWYYQAGVLLLQAKLCQ